MLILYYYTSQYHSILYYLQKLTFVPTIKEFKAMQINSFPDATNHF